MWTLFVNWLLTSPAFQPFWELTAQRQAKWVINFPKGLRDLNQVTPLLDPMSSVTYRVSLAQMYIGSDRYKNTQLLKKISVHENFNLCLAGKIFPYVGKITSLKQVGIYALESQRFLKSFAARAQQFTVIFG